MTVNLKIWGLSKDARTFGLSRTWTMDYMRFYSTFLSA